VVVAAAEGAFGGCCCSRATGNRAPNPDKPVKQYPVPAARCASFGTRVTAHHRRRHRI